ncbi:MAG: ectoine/hydroxyectoine ABC transporter substrate-binding protein EhuB, partial [Geminicoccales bacterium]
MHLISRCLTGAAFVALGAASAQADLLEEATESGEITVGIANEAPYGYVTPEGELTGEAPEIAKHILGEMGIDQVEAVV